MSGEVSKKAGWESFPEGKAHSKMGKQEDKYIKKKTLNSINCKVPYFKCGFCVISIEELHQSSLRFSSQGNGR